MEAFVTIDKTGINWRKGAPREPLIDYDAATISLQDGRAISVAAQTKEDAWRKRATLAQQFRLRGFKVKTRCTPGDDGTFTVVVALAA